MGNLVFQATLGGQVNLVGPNTASTYNLNVPTVNATLATTDANTFTAAQTISSGNLIFSGTGQKITGDYSNATLTNRAAFQTSTTNGSTGIYALPNGTSTAASWQATNAADPTNASKILIATNGSTDVQLVSGRNGTGTYLPLSFYTNGSAQMLLDTSGNLGISTTPSAWGSTWKAIQMNYGGSVFANNGVADIGLSSNAYWSDTSLTSNGVYIKTDGASYYRQASGIHYWFNAASGTSGTGIIWSERMRMDINGNLLIGNTTAAANSGAGVKIFGADNSNNISVVQTSSTNAVDAYHLYSLNAGAYRFYVDMSGTIHATSIVITAISDERLKENIRDIDTGLNSVMALKPRRYDWKEGKGLDKKNAAGFIAQEFEQVFPECIGTSKAGEDGIEYKNINYETLIPTLVKAIQEQQAIITQLQSDVEALKAPK